MCKKVIEGKRVGRQGNGRSGKRLYCPRIESEGRRLEHCLPGIIGLQMGKDFPILLLI